MKCVDSRSYYPICITKYMTKDIVKAVFYLKTYQDFYFKYKTGSVGDGNFFYFYENKRFNIIM